MKKCKHKQFESDVKVYRLKTPGQPTEVQAELMIRCADCKEYLLFKGVAAGLHPDRPTTNVESTELRIPLLFQVDEEEANHQTDKI